MWIGESGVGMPQAVATDSVSDQTATLNDDDIDVQDALDADLFPIFEEEATELLPQLVTISDQFRHKFLDN